MLQLPDRHAPLDFLDDEARAIDRCVAMSVTRGDRNADVTQGKRADPVLDDDRPHSVLLFRVAQDFREL